MSHFVQFRGFGVYGREISIAVARVTHCVQIESHGNYGVEVSLDSGKTVTVHGFVCDVEKALEAAAAAVTRDAA